jgi:hypothetical protein
MQGKMRNHLFAIAKWSWIACSVAVLLVTLYSYDGKPNSDADVLLAYGMLALSFPLSLLLSAIVGVVGYLAYSMYGYVLQTSYWSIVLTWMCFFIAGYWQWFKLLPWLIRRMRERKRVTV